MTENIGPFKSLGEEFGQPSFCVHHLKRGSSNLNGTKNVLAETLSLSFSSSVDSLHPCIVIFRKFCTPVQVSQLKGTDLHWTNV
jgi:hypothetical protein